MKPVLLLSLAVVFGTSAGCARFTSTTVGAAGGAYLGHRLSGGSALGTTLGAAGGAAVSEGAWRLKERAQGRAFEQGYLRGRSDAVKSNYFRLQEKPPESSANYRRLPLTLPARREGGVLYEPQTTTLIIAE